MIDPSGQRDRVNIGSVNCSGVGRDVGQVSRVADRQVDLRVGIKGQRQRARTEQGAELGDAQTKR